MIPNMVMKSNNVYIFLQFLYGHFDMSSAFACRMVSVKISPVMGITMLMKWSFADGHSFIHVSLVWNDIHNERYTLLCEIKAEKHPAWVSFVMSSHTGTVKPPHNFARCLICEFCEEGKFSEMKLDDAATWIEYRHGIFSHHIAICDSKNMFCTSFLR